MDLNRRGENMIYNSGTCEGKSKVWFIGDFDNWLYSISSKGEISIEAVIPLDKNVNSPYRANSYCLEENDCVYIFPDKAKTLYKYNINTKEIVQSEIKFNSSRYSIYWGCVIDNKLWCVTFNTGELLKINLKELLIEDIFSVSSRKEHSYRGEAISVGKKIYIVERNAPYIVEFDTESETMTKLEILCGEDGFGTIQFDGEKFFLTGYKKNIYIWNNKSGEVEIISLKEMEFIVENNDKKTTRFYNSRIIGDYYVVFPQNNSTYISSQIAILNINNYNINLCELHSDKGGRNRIAGEELIYNYSKGNKIYIQDYMQNDYWVVNLDNMEVDQVSMKYDNKENICFWKHYIELGNVPDIFREADSLNLEMFLEII